MVQEVFLLHHLPHQLNPPLQLLSGYGKKDSVRWENLDTFNVFLVGGKNRVHGRVSWVLFVTTLTYILCVAMCACVCVTYILPYYTLWLLIVYLDYS